MGAISTPSLQGSRYALVIVDHFSRQYFAYGLQQKSEAPHYIASFIIERESELDVPVASITTDNAPELNSNDFNNFLRSRGIRHQLIAPGTPTENAIAERAVDVLTELTRCLLLESSLPPEFWEFALQFATYVHNVTPCRSLPQNSSPMIRWKGQLPSYQHHRTFGSICFVHDGKRAGRFKFQPSAKTALFLGYAPRRGGYIVWPLQENKIIISRNVTFDEEKRISLGITGPQRPPTTSTPHLIEYSGSSSTSSGSGPPSPPDDPDEPPNSPDNSEHFTSSETSSADELPTSPTTPPPCGRIRSLRSWQSHRQAVP